MRISHSARPAREIAASCGILLSPLAPIHSTLHTLTTETLRHSTASTYLQLLLTCANMSNVEQPAHCSWPCGPVEEGTRVVSHCRLNHEPVCRHMSMLRTQCLMVVWGLPKRHHRRSVVSTGDAAATATRMSHNQWDIKDVSEQWSRQLVAAEPPSDVRCCLQGGKQPASRDLHLQTRHTDAPLGPWLLSPFTRAAEWESFRSCREPFSGAFPGLAMLQTIRSATITVRLPPLRTAGSQAAETCLT